LNGVTRFFIVGISPRLANFTLRLLYTQKSPQWALESVLTCWRREVPAWKRTPVVQHECINYSCWIV